MADKLKIDDLKCCGNCNFHYGKIKCEKNRIICGRSVCEEWQWDKRSPEDRKNLTK